MMIFGERTLASFAKKHADARKPLARFITVAEAARWAHFQELKQDFPSADLGKRSRSIIFDIGGNKYRLVALVNFEQQTVFIDQVLTHEEYSRKDL
jgi:mRNA interferase HigB